MLVICLRLAFSPALYPSASARPLRTVGEIRQLSNVEAKGAFLVELEGAVTYSDPEWGLLFLQDSTGSIYINVHGSSTVYPLGTRIRVEAVTAAGDVGPIISQAKIWVLGKGTLATPEQKSVAELDAGVADSSWVVTEGVLRPCDENWARICFRIFDGKTLAWLIVPQKDSPAAQSLIGATVRVKGVSGIHLDEGGKRVAAQLFVNGLDDIKVKEPSVEDSFSTDPLQIGSLRASAADGRFVRQVHVRGTVTWAAPGQFFVQDSTGTLFSATGKTVEVHIGSTVDVVGFPSQGEFGLSLSDAMAHAASARTSEKAVVPLQLTAAEVMSRSLNGRQVRLQARLISQSTNAAGYVYQLEDGEQRFSATLLRNDSTREIVGLSNNSVLEVTGVAVIRKGTPELPGSMVILIASPADIVVLGGNGWLTLRRGLSILGVVGLCVVAALTWIVLLRRTVRKQTGIIRSRLENELQLETKYRRLFERNLAAVFSWRPDGTIVDCNLAFARLLGFETREELIGRSYWDFQLAPTRSEELSGALSNVATSNGEAQLLRPDGTTVHLLKNITPVRDGEGVIYETTAIDVTRLRENEAELKRAKDAAVFESLNDPLTGLPNRRLLLDRLSFLVAKAERNRGIIALLYIDLDGFKLVNDSLGHPVGDDFLVQISASLGSRVRQADVLARVGGDEFIVILDDLEAKKQAAIVAQDLLGAISDPFRVKGHDLSIGASIGISTYPDDGSDPEELIRKADSAMYAAKHEGRNRIMHFTSQMGFLVNERLNLENQLRGAIARHEISVHYQPEFELITGRLVRFEALARWVHPTLGQIPPIKFIPIAEESGLIASLGAYIMEQACKEAVRWQSVAPNPIEIAVNVSSIQFRSKGFVEEVTSILERTNLRSELLQIELTESVMVEGLVNVAQTMERLIGLGTSLAIDDFGTGYSNLSYLPSLPFRALKIDRSFVKTLGSQPESESMIRTLIALAHSIGMRVIVEGVEESDQLELIRALGANEVQGYLLGRPTPNPIEVLLGRVEDSVLDVKTVLPGCFLPSGTNLE
ncbi:MAG: EAL domain-containing protein [Terracidiphilus sp.]|jgi:diguanylate cyclase (GGDEF)-like protein/PAS domain S-box-containing protein